LVSEHYPDCYGEKMPDSCTGIGRISHEYRRIGLNAFRKGLEYGPASQVTDLLFTKRTHRFKKRSYKPAKATWPVFCCWMPCRPVAANRRAAGPKHPTSNSQRPTSNGRSGGWHGGNRFGGRGTGRGWGIEDGGWRRWGHKEPRQGNIF